MATFYGQVQGNRETKAVRQGSKTSGIASSVQSYDGSITTKLSYGKSGGLMVQVYVTPETGFYGNLIFQGSIDEYCEKLCGKKFEEVSR